MAKANTDKLTIKHIVGYGCGDCGGSITLWMVAGFMTRFLQVHMQVNAGVLATMLLIWNIWDAVNDPLMGTIMDMCFAKAKPGADKFRPWILASIPIIAVGLIAFFVVPPHAGRRLCYDRSSLRAEDRLRSWLYHDEHRHGLPAGQHVQERF